MTPPLRRFVRPGAVAGERSGRTRLHALDGLRLFCALAVAGSHYAVCWRLDPAHPADYQLPVASRVLAYGFLGAEVFFMISGFVICMSSWGRGLGDFFVSRVSRLYPAFWACVLLTTVVVGLLPVTTGVPYPITEITLWSTAANLTMMAEPLGVPWVDGVCWTLWVEMRFYLLFALITWRGLTYRRAVMLCVLWMAAVFIAAGVNNPVLDTLVMPDWAPYFVAGIAMYLMYRFRPNALLWGIVGLCWLVSMHLVALRPSVLNPYFPGFLPPAWPGPLLLTGAYGVMLAIALGWTDRITWRWLGIAGALTYPFYLLHQRIGYSLMRTAHENTGLPAWSLMLGAVAAVLLLAWLVHVMFERPLMPLLRSGLRRALDDVRESSDPVRGAEGAAAGQPERILIGSGRHLDRSSQRTP